jgi:hypothetical protein
MKSKDRKSAVRNSDEGVADSQRAAAKEENVAESAFEEAKAREEETGSGSVFAKDSDQVFVDNATRRSIERALVVGSGLKEAARGTLTGIVRGNGDTGEDALNKIAVTSDALIRNASQAGADLGKTAHGAIEGGIEVARDVAVDAEHAATAAATAVLSRAQQLGPEAVEDVRPWTSTMLKGVRVEARG